MNQEASLIVIAEIAAALAGFSGIAATFGRRHAHPLTRTERARLADLLNHSGIALFAALVPLVFAQDVGFTPSLWRTSSLLWAGFASLGIAFGLREVAGQPTTKSLIRLYLPTIGFLALLALQLYNAMVWQAGWAYLLALVGNLGFAFIQFMGLVNPAARDDAD